jgi:hypothetical protein
MTDHICFVLADFGPTLGKAWLERDPGSMSRRQTLRDLIDGQFPPVVQILEVDAETHSAEDITEDMLAEALNATEAQDRRDNLFNDLWDHIHKLRVEAAE